MPPLLRMEYQAWESIRLLLPTVFNSGNFESGRLHSSSLRKPMVFLGLVQARESSRTGSSVFPNLLLVEITQAKNIVGWMYCCFKFCAPIGRRGPELKHVRPELFVSTGWSLPTGPIQAGLVLRFVF